MGAALSIASGGDVHRSHMRRIAAHERRGHYASIAESASIPPSGALMLASPHTISTPVDIPFPPRKRAVVCACTCSACMPGMRLPVYIDHRTPAPGVGVDGRSDPEPRPSGTAPRPCKRALPRGSRGQVVCPSPSCPSALPPPALQRAPTCAKPDFAPEGTVSSVKVPTVKGKAVPASVRHTPSGAPFGDESSPVVTGGVSLHGPQIIFVSDHTPRRGFDILAG